MSKQKKFNLLTVVIALTANMSVQAEEIPAIDCIIEPNVIVDLSSPVVGVLDTLTVDKSDEVKKGQLVATLNADVEAVNLHISKEKLNLSRVEYDRAVELYREKAITLSDKDKSENEKNLYELDIKHAQANLDLRKIRSPIDGVIVKRYAMPGEFVETRPILQIAQLDPLRIEVVSPVSNYGKIVKGMRAEILPEFGDYKTLIAKVVVVDKVIDAASGTFGVRLELSNKDYAIPGGLKCQVRFLPELAREDDIEAVTEVLNQFDADGSIMSEVADIDETLMCSSIGPYKDKEKLRLLLEELYSGIQKKELRTDTVEISYVVASEAYSSYAVAGSKIRSMKLDGIKDIARLNDDKQHRISFGLYNNKKLADNRVSDLLAKGYKVKLIPKSKKVSIYWADIIYSSEFVDTLNNLVTYSRRNVCGENIKLSLLK